MSAYNDPPLHAPTEQDALRVPPRQRRADSQPSRRIGVWLLWMIAVLAGLVLLPVIALRWLPPPTSAFMLQSAVKPVRYDWVPLARIAKPAGLAVVAAEDQKFWEHQGFDLEAIEKAVEHNRKSRRKRGASTISQQTAKNLFLWSGGGYFRKGIEAGYTILIEALWPKARILEVYLNIAEFGPGIYGVEAAAQQFFGKPAAKLTPMEAARLAAVLPSPRRWSVARPGPYVQQRTQWIVGQMGYGPRRAVAVEEPLLPPELEQDLAPDEASPLAEEPATEMPAPPLEEGDPASDDTPGAPSNLGPAPEPAPELPPETAPEPQAPPERPVPEAGPGAAVPTP